MNEWEKHISFEFEIQKKKKKRIGKSRLHMILHSFMFCIS